MDAQSQQSIDILFPLAARAKLREQLARLGDFPGYTEAQLDDGITAYARFLLLKLTANDADATGMSPSDAIDAIWHAHLLDTKAYAACCERLGAFMHHDPDLAVDQAARRGRYLRTYLMLCDVCPDVPDARWWPEPDQLAGLIGKVLRRGQRLGEERATAAHNAASPQVAPGAAANKKRARADAPASQRSAKRARPEPVPSVAFVIRTLTGKTLQFDLPRANTLQDVFERIQAREGIPPDQCMLVYKGERYKIHGAEDVTLDALGIAPGEAMHLILNLTGC